MKVYKFFKKPNEKLSKIPNSDISIEQKYPLYALTTDKKMAKLFMKTRNMDLFLYKVDDMDNGVVDDFVVSKRNRLMESYEFCTTLNKHTEKQEKKFVNVVMTENEIDLVMEYGDTGEIMNVIQEWIPIEIFDNECREALRILMYDKSIGFATGVDGYLEINRLDFPVDFDLFWIFLFIYGDTLSPEFFEYSTYHEEPAQLEKR